MRDLLVPLDEPDVIEGSDLRREASVDAQHLTVYEGGHRQHVEDAAAVAPGVGVAVLVLAFVVEPVHLKLSLF
jgi:hypothetical protein